jgi:hypothetical protein
MIYFTGQNPSDYTWRYKLDMLKVCWMSGRMSTLVTSEFVFFDWVNPLTLREIRLLAGSGYKTPL